MAVSTTYLDDPRFHQVFELPANPQDGRAAPFKITYADFGYRNESQPEQENVMLFFPPLLGSRLVQITKDALAQQHKIRIIAPDRPGIGRTDNVDATKRMSIWLEAMPALLAHLHIPHVHIACHSGGAPYALDFILHHPELLYTDRPYLALGAPWILPSHTSATALYLASTLPTGLVQHTDKVARALATYIGPAVGASIGSSMNLLGKIGPQRAAVEEDVEEDAGGGDLEGQRFEEAIWSKVIARIYEESVAGVGDEVVMLLQKTTGGFSDWGDYDVLVPRLVEGLRTAQRRLRVDVFWAEDDIVVGDGNTKGPAWFDKCWEAPGVEGIVDYSSTVVKGADHDRIWNLRWHTMKTVFERIGQSSEGSSGSAAQENSTVERQ